MSRGRDQDPVVRPVEKEGPEARPDKLRDQDPQPAPERELGRDRFQLTDAQAQTLAEIGRFRTVEVADLQRFRFGGDQAQAERVLHSLVEVGLVVRRSAYLDKASGPLAVVVLSKRGRQAAERATSSDQTVYSGFVKPAEVAHDAAIYRMFQKESAVIEKAGGRVRRVVLDYELKRRIYSPLAKARQISLAEYARRQQEVAREIGLKVVDGKIPLPDLRIEYETASGEMARVDLELATHHYHGSHLETKAEAGFKMYAASGGERLTAALEEREITAAIFSL